MKKSLLVMGLAVALTAALYADKKPQPRNIAEMEIDKQRREIALFHRRVQESIRNDLRGKTTRDQWGGRTRFGAGPYNNVPSKYWAWGNNWNAAWGDQTRYLWYGPQGWNYNGQHGSVMIDIGNGSYWWGGPDDGWHRAYRHNNLYWVHDWNAPRSGRRYIVYDPQYRYWNPGYYSQPYPVGPNQFIVPAYPGTVTPVDAYKMFIPIDEYKRRKAAEDAAKAREQKLKVPPEARPAEQPQPGQPAGNAAAAPRDVDVRIPAEERQKMLDKIVNGGLDLFRKKQYANAAAYFSLAKHIDPNGREARKLFILSLVATTQYDKAEVELRELTAMQKAQAKALPADLYADKAEMAKHVLALQQYANGPKAGKDAGALLKFYMTAMGQAVE